MSPAEIILSKESANDETALIVAIYAPDGSSVEADQLLFDAESSKATQEIRAPAAGVLSHALAVGQEIGFGVPLGRIMPAAGEPLPAGADRPAGTVGPERAADAPPPTIRTARERPAPPAAVQGPPAIAVRHFSRAAIAALEDSGLAPDAFSANFVTAADVRARKARAPAGAPPPPTTGEPVAARKRAEIELLGGGAGGTLLSVLGTNLGPLRIRRPPGSFLEGRIVDLVIFEAARLMRRYPKLNAAYRDGRLVIHPGIHAGLAMDDGGRLVVYGIADADRLSLADLSDVVSDAVSRYLADALSAAELTRATFTVTDLSEGPLDFVFPLLPRGQSCILGIVRDAAGAWRLFAGFDHRATEGREVSSFLGELRDRILSFSQQDDGTEEATCLYCSRSAAAAAALAKDKGLLRIVDPRGRDALCCASCWNGW